MAKLRLNIYSNKKDENGKRIIEKTYESDTCEILYGVVEDLLGTIDVNDMKDKDILKVIVSAIKQIKPLLKDVFFGLTDEELKRTVLNEVVAVVIAIFKFSTSEILSDDNIKNLMGELKK